MSDILPEINKFLNSTIQNGPMIPLNDLIKSYGHKPDFPWQHLIVDLATKNVTIPHNGKFRIYAFGDSANGPGGGSCVDERDYIKGDILACTLNASFTTVTCSARSLSMTANASTATDPGTATGGNVDNAIGGTLGATPSTPRSSGLPGGNGGIGGKGGNGTDGVYGAYGGTQGGYGGDGGNGTYIGGSGGNGGNSGNGGNYGWGTAGPPGGKGGSGDFIGGTGGMGGYGGYGSSYRGASGPGGIGGAGLYIGGKGGVAIDGGGAGVGGAGGYIGGDSGGTGVLGGNAGGILFGIDLGIATDQKGAELPSWIPRKYIPIPTHTTRFIWIWEV